jgi:hypothetical protein
MGLSSEEKRELREIERALIEEDPNFARVLRAELSVGYMWMTLARVTMAVSALLIIMGIVLHDIAAVALGGAILFAVLVVWLFADNLRSLIGKLRKWIESSQANMP